MLRFYGDANPGNAIELFEAYRGDRLWDSPPMLWSNPTMQVIGPFRFNAAQGVQANSRISNGTSGAAANPSIDGGAKTQGQVDQLDLSPEALAASSNSATNGPATVGGDMRLEKIADLRRQIASGTYDTPERFEEAFGRMLDSFG